MNLLISYLSLQFHYNCGCSYSHSWRSLLSFTKNYQTLVLVYISGIYQDTLIKLASLQFLQSLIQNNNCSCIVNLFNSNYTTITNYIHIICISITKIYQLNKINGLISQLPRVHNSIILCALEPHHEYDIFIT